MVFLNYIFVQLSPSDDDFILFVNDEIDITVAKIFCGPSTCLNLVPNNYYNIYFLIHIFLILTYICNG